MTEYGASKGVKSSFTIWWLLFFNKAQLGLLKQVKLKALKINLTCEERTSKLLNSKRKIKRIKNCVTVAIEYMHKLL